MLIVPVVFFSSASASPGPAATFDAAAFSGPAAAFDAAAGPAIARA